MVAPGRKAHQLFTLYAKMLRAHKLPRTMAHMRTHFTSGWQSGRPTSMARGVVLALLVVGWVLAALAGCALHPGGQEIAFLRAGQLVAINPDGSDPRMLSSGSVVSFAWSPDHHQLVYRSALHP